MSVDLQLPVLLFERRFTHDPCIECCAAVPLHVAARVVPGLLLWQCYS